MNVDGLAGDLQGDLAFLTAHTQVFNPHKTSSWPWQHYPPEIGITMGGDFGMPSNQFPQELPISVPEVIVAPEMPPVMPPEPFPLPEDLSKMLDITLAGAELPLTRLLSRPATITGQPLSQAGFETAMTTFTDHYHLAPITSTSAKLAQDAATYLQDAAENVQNAALRLQAAVADLYPRQPWIDGSAPVTHLTTVPSTNLSLHNGPPPASPGAAHSCPSTTPSLSWSSLDESHSRDQHHSADLSSSPSAETVHSDLSRTTPNPHESPESSAQITTRPCPACDDLLDVADLQEHIWERHPGLKVNFNADSNTMVKQSRCPYCWIRIDRTRLAEHIDSGCTRY